VAVNDRETAAFGSPAWMRGYSLGQAGDAEPDRDFIADRDRSDYMAGYFCGSRERRSVRLLKAWGKTELDGPPTLVVLKLLSASQ
jgi:hypothetical protein